jgi:hypothetical protein
MQKWPVARRGLGRFERTTADLLILRATCNTGAGFVAAFQEGSMRSNVCRFLFAVVPFATCASLCGSARAAPGSPFDGSWQATLACKVTPDGLGKPYSWDFTGAVRNGFVTMQHGQKGMRASAALSGKIGAGGDAMLRLNGIAGDAGYNIGYLKAGTPIHFSASVHFDATHGDGSRDDGRDCALHFMKQ